MPNGNALPFTTIKKWESRPGYKDYPGTGFLIDGTARYFSSGDDYDFMKHKFSFLTRVLEITVETAKQML